jgi:enoyl-CoA hydratase/carnithine racemase
MCLTPRSVAAHEARELGLAEFVVATGRLDAAVADLTAALLATDAATARAAKRLLVQAPGHTLEQQAAAERRAQAELQGERLGRLPRR